MSNFNVLVIGENQNRYDIVLGEDSVKAQLDPFWELDLYPEEMAEDPRAEFRIEIPHDNIPVKAKEIAEDYIAWQRERSNPDMDKIQKYTAYLEHECWIAILDDYQGGGQDIHGNWGYWHNPRAKWDWYQIGGRWRGYFKLKPYTIALALGDPSWCNENQPVDTDRADQAFKGDIDWKAMKAQGRAEGESQWTEHLKKLESGDETYSPYFDYRIRQGETRETFIARAESVATFAVVKDGEWYERGEMGWWACISNEKPQDQWDEEFDKLVMGLPDHTLLTLVDCHI